MKNSERKREGQRERKDVLLFDWWKYTERNLDRGWVIYAPVSGGERDEAQDVESAGDREDR